MLTIIISQQQTFSYYIKICYLFDKTFWKDKFDILLVEVYRCDKLLDSRDKMAFAIEFNFEERVELIVVEVDNLAFRATYAGGEASPPA